MRNHVNTNIKSLLILKSFREGLSRYGSAAAVLQRFPSKKLERYEPKSVFVGSIKDRILDTFILKTGGQEEGLNVFLRHINLINNLPLYDCEIFLAEKQKKSMWALVVIKGGDEWTRPALKCLRRHNGFMSAGGFLSFHEKERVQRDDVDPLADCLDRIFRQKREREKNEISVKRSRDDSAANSSGITPEQKKTKAPIEMETEENDGTKDQEI